MNDWELNYKAMSKDQLLNTLSKLRENKLQKQYSQKETYILNELRIKS